MKKILKQKIKHVVILVTILTGIITNNSFSAFKDIGYGARPLGMGGAFVALSDDFNGLLSNPSGVAEIGNPEVGFMYSKLFMGLEEVNLSLGYAGIVYPITDTIGTIGVSWNGFVSEKQYKEDIVGITYAKKFELKKKIVTIKKNNNGFGLRRNKTLEEEIITYETMSILSCGINIKYLSHTYELDKRTINDPVFATGNSKDNVGIDFGTRWSPQKGPLSSFAFGLAVKNINQPDVGLDSKDIVPMETSFGMVYQIPEFSLIDVCCNSFLSLEASYRVQEWGKDTDKIDYKVGLENYIGEVVILRLGGNSTDVSFGLGLKLPEKFNINLQFDYALLFPIQIKESTGSHRLAIVYRFAESN